MTQLNFTWVTTITITIANNESSKVTNEDNTLETGKMYLGIYTFLINEALLMIEDIDILVASEKKL